MSTPTDLLLPIEAGVSGPPRALVAEGLDKKGYTGHNFAPASPPGRR